MNEALANELLDAIHAENLARYAANAAEPYVHATYADHEQRIYRLVDALADGNQELADKFNEALHDITHDGLGWMRQVWRELRAEIGYKKAAKDLREGDKLINWGLVVGINRWPGGVEVVYQDDISQVCDFTCGLDELLAVSY